MTTDETIALVSADLDAEVAWHAAKFYACPVCNRPSVDGRPHRRCARPAGAGAAVAEATLPGQE